LVEAAAKLAAVNAAISFLAPVLDADLQFDVGSIHYKGWYYQGDESDDLSKAYGRNLRSKLRKGGVCWLPGGAGAMGQMHSQLAVESPDGPSRILVSDMDDTRLEHVRELLEPIAKRRGVEFKLLNPTKFKTPGEFDAELRRFAPEGFDDIVMLVPVPAVLSAAAKFLKADGLMNIFAGIPAGKEAALSLKDIAVRACATSAPAEAGPNTFARLSNWSKPASSIPPRPWPLSAACAIEEGARRGRQAKFPGRP
jgi:threonine dehydrogenase-like Zn-dependent dehydrogenase